MHCQNFRPSSRTRREMLNQSACGFGAVALSALLAENSSAKKADYNPTDPLAPKKPHYAPKAKNVIFLYMDGGPSHVDTFDYKPLLKKFNGQDPRQAIGKLEPTQFDNIGKVMQSPWAFKQHGESGAWVSDLFPNIAKVADDLTFIKSMTSKFPEHTAANYFLHTGSGLQGRPSMGAWVGYGLGTENQNLPGFVTMCPGGYPVSRTQNWQSGFLPAAYQGTYVDTKTTNPRKLIDHVTPTHLSRKRQRDQLDFLHHLNEEHARKRNYDSDLEARLQSFELAYRMQLEATDAFDVSLEPQYIRDLYGDNLQGRQMLITRRLVERGVRFVQVWHGAGQPWDNHDDLEKNHRRLARECDQAIGALLIDLKQRGMLDETLVLWGGEFGRTPVVEMPKEGTNAGKINGRDHNHYGFTTWMAGGGVKGGHVHGATDDFGFQAVKDKVHVHDLHATMLHQLGFDHEKLTYRYSGRDFRLTDVHGDVVHDLLA